jgi:hypothetical protein
MYADYVDHIVTYSLKARIVESQQTAITRHRPVNNRTMAFSAQSVPMAVQEILEYVRPSLSNICTATKEWCFLHGPCLDVISRASSEFTLGTQCMGV